MTTWPNKSLQPMPVGAVSCSPRPSSGMAELGRYNKAMMLGFGWCHLQTSREPLRDASPEDHDHIDAQIDRADGEMFTGFRAWMAHQNDAFLAWTLLEQHNNHCGLLTYSLSRNHRSSAVWGMLKWIVANATGSYGLFYCYDDEANAFRVHRIKNGRLDELADPFFGFVDGDMGPCHSHETETQQATKCEQD